MSKLLVVFLVVGLLSGLGVVSANPYYAHDEWFEQDLGYIYWLFPVLVVVGVVVLVLLVIWENRKVVVERGNFG